MKRKGKGQAGVRPKSPPNKKRKLDDQQEPTRHEDADFKGPTSISGIDAPGIGRGKRTRATAKKRTAVQPKEQKPGGLGEKPVENSTGQAGGNANVPQRRKSSLLEEQILDLLRDVSPSESNTLSGAGNENVRPMPPSFRDNLRDLRESGQLSEAVEQYYLNLGRGDSVRVPGEGGRKSLLEDVLKIDVRQPGNSGGLGWKPGKNIGYGSFGHVMLWEKARPPLRIATKDIFQPDAFFHDYNSEGNLIRRLNDAGCKNVVKVLDWFLIHGIFRTCFEYAEFANLWELEHWYRQRNLVLPEAFIWHVFYGVANALCYCRHGTNKPHSRAREPRWDRIIHGDLKEDNILLAAPDKDCHRLYPCIKLCDFGHAFTLGEPQAELRRFKSTGWKQGASSFLAPEVRKYVPGNRLPRAGELQDCYSDIYSLGVFLGQVCHYADKFLAAPIKDLLHGDMSANPSGKRIFSSYYSDRLKELIRRCRSANPLERPSNHDLYLETKSWMEAFRELTYRAEQESPAPVIAGIAVHHNKVLYTKEEQKLFDKNAEFRQAYITVNTNPVFEAEDLDVAGSERVKRKFEKMLQKVDQSILTAIPSHVVSSNSDVSGGGGDDDDDDDDDDPHDFEHPPSRPAIDLTSKGPSHEIAQEIVGPRSAGEAVMVQPPSSRTRRQRIHEVMNAAKFLLNSVPKKE